MPTMLESLVTIVPLLGGETFAWAFWLRHDVRMGQAGLGVSEFRVLMLRLFLKNAN